jgi:hypothetical protein
VELTAYDTHDFSGYVKKFVQKDFSVNGIILLHEIFDMRIYVQMIASSASFSILPLSRRVPVHVNLTFLL